MIDLWMWVLLSVLTVCVVPALVLCVQWFYLCERLVGENGEVGEFGEEHQAAKRRRGALPRSVLLVRLAHLTRQVTGSLPALLLTLFLLTHWPHLSPSSPWVWVALVPAFAGVVLLVSLLVAVCQGGWWLACNWSAFRCVYWLPEDADKVRMLGVRHGILAAATVFPQQVFQDDEEIELATLSGTIQLKQRHFPRQQQFWRWMLTNDFAAYCALTREAYVQGYRRFYAECQDAGDQLVALRDQLLQEKRCGGEPSLLNGYARRYLQALA